ncbi:MAG: hypothetical protein ABIY55_30960 [Kofleriaceae bacterium]
MRRTFAESSSPQGPAIALDKLVEALRDAVTAALATTPRLAFDRVVAELECAFANVERAVVIAAAPLDHSSRRLVGEMRALVSAMLPLELFPSSRAVLLSKGRHVMDDANAALCAVDGDDVCLLQEHDLTIVDAFDGFHRHLAAVNSAVNELKDASLQRDVTAILLARANLAWDILDAHLRFLAAMSRNGARVRRTPGLLAAVARLRSVLAGGLSYRRDPGTAGDLSAQSGRLAERLQVYEREDDPASSGEFDLASLPRARRFDHCLMVRSTRSTGRKHG